MAQDSSRPDFWESRYRDHVMPWDAQGVPAEFIQHAETLPIEHRVLIPGCGTGYEVGWLASRGRSVLAIDFSPAAVAMAHQTLGEYGQHVQEADFFALDTAPFDWVYERAFLCALPRKMWADYVQKMAELVRVGGQLAGFFFCHETHRGPPFGASQEELQALLEPYFTLTHTQPSTTSLPVFAGHEHWQCWTRRDTLPH